MPPTTEEPDDDFASGQRRSAQEVAQRCIILSCVCASLEFSPGYFNDWLQQEGLWEHVSPREQKFLTSDKPSRREIIRAGWCAESLQVLLWALGKLKGMTFVSKRVMLEKISSHLPEVDTGTRDFIASASLRPDAEIDTELQAMIHAHWLIENEKLHPVQKAAEMLPGVITERQQALEWMINRNGDPWDEVTANT